MTPFGQSTFRWLVDYQLLSLLLLTAATGASLLLRQPARRLATAKGAIVGLALLAVLCAAPGWSVFHLVASRMERADSLLVSQGDVAPVDLMENQPVALTVAESSPPSARSEASMPLGSVATMPAASRPPVDRTAMILSGVYFGGGALVLLWLASGAVYANRLRAAAQPAPAKWQSILRELVGTASPTPELLVSDQVDVPVALGLRRPAIVFPRRRLVVYAASETQSAAPSVVEGDLPADVRALRSILGHELAHIRHGDLRLLAASRALLVLLWPQPLYWWLRRRVRVDQEVLADVAAAELTNRLDYAQQLVSWAKQTTADAGARGGPRSRRSSLAAAVGLWERPAEFKRRIATLLDERLTILRSASRRWRLACGAGAAAAAITLSLMTTEPAHRAAAAGEPQATGETVTKSNDAADRPTERANADAVSEAPADTLNEHAMSFFRGTKPNPNFVAGICLDELGQPLAGVEVSLYVYEMGMGGGDPDQTRRLAVQTTGQDGIYRFVNAIDVEASFPGGLPAEHFQVSPTKAIAAIARAPGRATVWQNNAAISMIRRGEIQVLRLPPAETLRGTVTDRRGQPIAGAAVTAGQKGGYFATVPGVPLFSAVTDAEGQFAVEDVEFYDEHAARQEHAAWIKQLESSENGYWLSTSSSPDPHAFQPRQLMIQHPDFATKRTAVTSIPAELNVVLDPGAVVTGRAVYREGEETQPAPGVRLYLQRYADKPQASPQTRDFQAHEIRSTTTDQHGGYRISSLPPGTYRLDGNAGADWVSAGVEAVSSVLGQSTTADDLVFTRGGVVRAQLVDAETGKPLALPGGAKGWLNVNRALGSPREGLPFSNPIVEFSAEGVAMRHVSPGRVIVFASIPDENGAPRLTSLEAGKPLDQWPSFEVAEGKTVDVKLSMRQEKEAPRATATWTLIPAITDPATEDEAADEDSKADKPVLDGPRSP